MAGCIEHCDSSDSNSTGIALNPSRPKIHHESSNRTHLRLMRSVSESSIYSDSSSQALHTRHWKLTVVRSPSSPCLYKDPDRMGTEVFSQYDPNRTHSHVNSPGQSHENYDIFIPEAYRACDEDEREKYEEFIDEVFKPLMTKHNLKWYCFRNDAPTDGTVNRKIREAQAHCWMSLIVLCKAILDNQYLQMLGCEHVVYLQIDKNIKELPGVLHHQTTLRFISDKEREVGMKRIKADIDSKKTHPLSLDIGMKRFQLSNDKTQLAWPRICRMDTPEATTLCSSPSTFDENFGRMRPSRSRSRSTPEFDLDDDEFTSDPYLIKTSSPIRDQAPIQRLSPCVTSPPNIATKVTYKAMGSFYKVHHPRTNASVFVSSKVEKYLWHIKQEDQESICTENPDYILRFVIPSALSKDTRQYLELAYLASDNKYPIVVKQALFGLWELLVLRPRKIDKTFVSLMVSVEAELRPRGDTSRWTVNADIAIMFIELYQMIISFIFLGFFLGTTVQIPGDEFEAIRTGVAKLDRLVKDKFAALHTKFQYFKGKIIDPCIESMMRKARTVPKRPKKRTEARHNVIPTIHRLMQPELDSPQRDNVVKLTMQYFGNLRDHGQITVFHYCCLLTRDMETELRVSFDDILKQMVMALLKNMPEAVMQGLVFRCYGCEMASHDSRQQDSSFISVLEEKVSVISPLKKRHHKAESPISTMFLMKLLFHSDERLRKLLAKNLILDDSTLNRCIQQPFHDISHAATVLHVEASLRMYGLELKIEPQTKYAATFSRLWPNDGTSVVYSHGSFGHLSPNNLCKMVNITRRGHLIGSDDVAKTTQTIQAEIKALEYVHQRRDTCDHILEMLAFNADIRSGPLFYIVKCSNEQNLSSHLKDLRDKPNRNDVFKLVDFCLGALLAFRYCKENNILVTSATAASFLLHQEGQSYIPKLALQEGCIVGSLEHLGEKHDRVPVEFSAPETLLKCIHSTQSMAYLTSMILFEILSLGVHPFEEIDLPRGAKILQILKYRLKPERRRVIPERLYIGLSMCWLSTPGKRATIEDLHPFFEDFTYKHKPIENSSCLQDHSLDTMWREECAYLNTIAWKQPPIPNLKRPPELENLHRFSDLWKTPDDDKEYIQYCCGSVTTKCSPNELIETDDPMKIKVEVGYWSCPLKLGKPNAQAIGKLQEMDHVNVSKVDQVQCRESRVCINTYSDTTVIEFMTGRHLPEPERINIYKQMVEGVNYVHKLGFVHCHISPKAFYINPESHEVRLGNLGRCTLLNLDEFDENITQAVCRPFKEIPRSSWRWLPIETLTSRSYRTSTDVFSLGLTIWVLETANSHASTSEPLYSFAPFSYRAADELSTVHLSRHTLPRAADCPLNMDKLIQACTSYPACCRPIMTEIVAFFADPQSKVIILPDDTAEPPNDYDTPNPLHTENTDVMRRRISRMLLQSRDEQCDFYTMDARQYTHSMLAQGDVISPVEYDVLPPSSEDVSQPRLSRLQSVWKYFGKKNRRRNKPFVAPEPLDAFKNASYAEIGIREYCHLSMSSDDVNTYEVINDKWCYHGESDN